MAEGMLAGLPMKSIVLAGASGFGGMVITDYFVESWWKDESSEDAEPKRAAAQAALGIVGGMILKRWNKAAGIGFATGGVIGGAYRYWVHKDGPQWLEDMFRSDETDNTSNSSSPAQRPAQGVALPPPGSVTRIVFSNPDEREAVRVADRRRAQY